MPSLASEPDMGARDPHACASKEPASGAPSGDRLKELILCGKSGERVYDQDLYLLANVQVEIGKSRPYQTSDSLAQNIDPSQPVYPIRGSYDKYQCVVINTTMKLKGHSAGDNCSLFPQPQAEGICYRTTFGDWECSM